MNSLKITNLKVSIGKKDILEKINLEIKENEIHVIMGKNGSGKSTLLNSIMGNPDHTIKEGKILLNNKEIQDIAPNKRANQGLFLAFQNPIELPGVSFRNFLREALNKKIKSNNEDLETISPLDFIEISNPYIKSLKLDDYFIIRHLNDGFSGGEKKKAEILQMAILKPKFAMLDEIDSGLDVDALKEVSNTINLIKKENNCGIIIVTHYNRILKYINADFVHILDKGKIIKSGNKKIAEDIEKHGFDKFLK